MNIDLIQLLTGVNSCQAVKDWNKNEYYYVCYKELKRIPLKLTLCLIKLILLGINILISIVINSKIDSMRIRQTIKINFQSE
jgi:hypothetical protein